MTKLETAQADFEKKNKRLQIAVGILLAYVVIMLSFVTVTTLVTQSTIAKNQRTNAVSSEARFKRYTDDNAAEHQKTQQYVRCIAQVLLLPIQSRTNEAFDQCSTTGSYNGKSSGATSQATTGSQPTKSTASIPATVNPTNPQPTTQPRTTSSPPPDPENTTTLDRLPLVGGLLNRLGL